ncbi:DMT family transporter [Roseateles sp. GG27B]
MLTLPPLLWQRRGGPIDGGQRATAGLERAALGLGVAAAAALRPALAGQPRPAAATLALFALAGFLGIGCYNALQYQALHSSSVLNVTLIAASMPVWMLAVGAALYRVRPTRQQLLGAALSLLGVAFVISRGHLSALAQVQFVIGDLLMLLAIFCWSLYSWLLARPPASMQGSARPAWDWAELLMAQLVFGLLFAGSMAGLEQLVPSVQAIHWGPGLALALIYVAVGPSLIAYRCWGLGVAEAGPAMAAFFGNLTPVFAALMSAAMLGEWPQWYHGIAFLLIGAGIVVSAARR